MINMSSRVEDRDLKQGILSVYLPGLPLKIEGALSSGLEKLSSELGAKGSSFI